MEKDLLSIKEEAKKSLNKEIEILNSISKKLEESSDFYETVECLLESSSILKQNFYFKALPEQLYSDFFKYSDATIKAGVLKFSDEKYYVKFYFLDKYIEIGKHKRTKKPDKLMEEQVLKDDIKKHESVMKDYKKNPTRKKRRKIVSEYKKRYKLSFFWGGFSLKNKFNILSEVIDSETKESLQKLKEYNEKMVEYEKEKEKNKVFLKSIEKEINEFLQKGWEIESYIGLE